MGKVFCIDVSKCSGCYNCQFACKDEHCNNEWLPYAAQQPMIGQFWLRVDEHVQGTRPKIKIHYIPVLCNHCADPACMKAAENGAVYKREDGLVIIDPEKAAGQKQIAQACPYGAIFWNEELSLPQKCTGCAHLLAEGKTPRCVDVCHTGAIRFGEESEFQEFIDHASVRLPDSGTGPRVYYRNIPGRFIAGTVYDPEEEVVVRGALCRLKPAKGAQQETETDIFGDFWFKELPAGVYDLTIEAEGFEPLSFTALDTEKDSINLGDRPMKRIQKGNV